MLYNPAQNIMQLQTFKYFAEHIVGYIYPPRCVACRCLLSDSKYLCPECADKFGAHKIFNRFVTAELQKDDIDSSIAICDKCGEIMPVQNIQFGHCPICRAAPYAANHIRSLYTYNDDTRSPLLTFKYFQKFGLAKLFSEIILQNLGPDFATGFRIFPESDWDYILPVPSSPDILRTRGYNHMYLTTKIVAKKLGCKTTPDFLISGKNRAAQTMLTPKERIKNVKGAFAISKRGRDNLGGAKILLLDDMLTTGSTIDAATKALINDGNALSVDVLTVFRSGSFARDRIKIAINHKVAINF